MRLKFDGGEIIPNKGVTTLGRTPDNDISFPNDSNVSRHHAEIELRGNEYCLIDLSSSNGTAVNGAKVAGETYLKAGDRIMLGGTSELIFDEYQEAAAEPAENPAPVDDIPVNLPPVGSAVQQLPSVAASPASGGSKTMLIIAGGAVLLAVVVVGVAGTIYYKKSTSACGATARIKSPEKYDTVTNPTDIELETANFGCVKKVMFTLDGKEFVQADEDPYSVKLDPKDHPDESDGELHNLGVVLIDSKGQRLPQPDQIPLILETRRAAREVVETDTKTEQPAGPEGPPVSPTGKVVTLIDIRDKTLRFSKPFPGARAVPNKEFLVDVQKRTSDFAKAGYYQQAAAHKDRINLAFVRDKGLPPSFGFIFAMSRSGYDPKKQGDGEGMWRISQALVATQKFGGDCTESLSDPNQGCAANAAAAYLKELYFTACGEDFMCAAAAFGKTIQDAAAWKAGLANNSGGLWNSLRPGPERDQLVSFIAAGVVAENPKSFGLDRDQPISSLYP